MYSLFDIARAHKFEVAYRYCQTSSKLIFVWYSWFFSKIHKEKTKMQDIKFHSTSSFVYYFFF